MPRRRRFPLSKGAQSLLQRIAAAQRSLNAFPHVSAVIRSQSAREWDSLHVLCQRMLVETLDGQRLRLTRDGWRVAGNGGA